MFTQSCFIRKNTPELREKLRNMGYEYHGKENITDSLSSLHCCNGWYYECNLVPLDYYSIADCETNEELFLAIAALRDDTDKNQWFVMDVDFYSDIKKGDWFRATDVNGQYHIGTKVDPLYCHKATVQELIEHFIDK